MVKFGELMKALRQGQGITLTEAAKKLGTVKGYISGIELSRVNAPSVKILIRAARLYGVHAEDLVEFAWASKAPALIRERVLAKLENPLAAAKVEPARPVAVELPKSAIA